MTPVALSGQTGGTASLKDALIIKRISLPLNFDGIPDEEAWKEVVPLNMIMHSPVFGKDPTEITDARIGFDDKYLYMASKQYYYIPA